MTVMSIPCFPKLSWKDLQRKRKIQKALMFFMCLHVQTVNGLVAEYLTSRFVTRNESRKLVVLFPSTN